MKCTWLYIRDPEQWSSETSWYRSLFGDKNVLDFIKTIVERRDKLDKKGNEDKNAIKDVMMDRIKMYDDTITHIISEL
jgi:hypothetical protein